MKPTPLLDFWQKPVGAGAPVTMLATTYALDPDFFEQNCLARFLEVSSVDENTGSVDDIVASVELHDLLQHTCVTVMADRSAPVQRSSLLWDLLSCQVDGGLLHAKVSVLIWENATRVILGSANLTSAGYRRQIELGLAVDLGPDCLFPTDVLQEIADELDSYLLLVPGYAPDIAVFKRAASTLKLFRQRVAQYSTARTEIRVAFAPTNANQSPLDKLDLVWKGAQPLCATHLSPFWDSNDRKALIATNKLLTGRPANKRKQRVGVVLNPSGQTSFSQYLASYENVDNSVYQLKEVDQEIRTLHAKCLLIESDEWVAALVGSSNHTKSGLGLNEAKRGPILTQPRRHREMNVWIGASRKGKAGRALLDLIPLGKKVTADTAEVDPKDEDEDELPALPGCFGMCCLHRPSEGLPWELHLGITSGIGMPSNWEIGFAADDVPILTKMQWEASVGLGPTVISLIEGTLPMFVFVRWDGNKIPWAVVADDRHSLPPGPALSGLRAQQLLDALATGRSLSSILREDLERRNGGRTPNSEISLDPLKRFEVEGALLRKGRALAASLSAMQRRLERQVVTADALKARLAGPLGPTFVATKVVEALEQHEQSRAEAIFTIAEISLTIGRVNWAHVLEHIDRSEGIAIINHTLNRLDALRERAGCEPLDLVSYACRAVTEARKCLAS